MSERAENINHGNPTVGNIRDQILKEVDVQLKTAEAKLLNAITQKTVQKSSATDTPDQIK